MHVEDFDRLFATVRKTNPDVFVPSSEPTPRQTIGIMSTEFGVVLPADFRWFLARYGAGRVTDLTLYSADVTEADYLPENQPVPPLSDHVVFGLDDDGAPLAFPAEGDLCRDEIVRLEETGPRLVDGAGFFSFLAARLDGLAGA